LCSYVVSSGFTLEVATGGTALGTTVSRGGYQIAEAGGLASGTAINSGGR